MSNISNPKSPKKDDRIGNDHNKLYNDYTPRSKHKFEGWPILWILIAIFLIFTGTVHYVIRWIAS